MTPDTQLPPARESDDEYSGTPLRQSTGNDGPGQGVPSLPAPTDNFWAFAVKINVAVMFLAICGSLWAFDALEEHPGMSSWWSTVDAIKRALLTSILAIPSVYAMMWILLRVMVDYPKMAVQIAAVAAVLMSAVAVALLLQIGMVLDATVLVILWTIVGYFAAVRGDRIKLAASNLKVAARAIQGPPQIVDGALCSMAARALLIAAVSLCKIGYDFALFHQIVLLGGVHAATHSRNTTSNLLGSVLLRVMKYSVMWLVSVIGRVVAATVASSVASWCCSSSNVEPVWVSLRRATHFSLGSLSKIAVIGCLVGPILVVPENLLRSVTSGLIQSVYRGVNNVSLAAILLRSGARFLGVQPVIFEYNTSGVGVKSGIFTGGAWPMLGLLLAASYVLQYTVFFMSMHRLGFLEAVRRTKSFLQTHGLTIIINDTMLVTGASLLFLVSFAMVFFVVFAGAAILPYEPYRVAGNICAWAVSPAIFVVSEVVMYSFKGVFICFTQEPEVFTETHGPWD